MSASADPDFDNPFAAYLSKRSAALKDGRPEVYPPPVESWFIVCTANLPVPVFLGFMLTRDLGHVGLVLGVAAVYWIGYRACFTAGDEVRDVVRGGWILAFLQLIPILQILVGVMGLAVVEVLSSLIPGISLSVSADTLLGSLIVTLIIAMLMVALASALGAIMRGGLRQVEPIKVADDPVS